MSEILDMNQKQIVQLEAAKELNRLKGRPPVARKINLDRPEIFSMNDQFSKYKPDKIDMIQTAGLKVSAAVAQWEQKVMEERTSVIFCQLRKRQLEATKEAEDWEKNEESAWREQGLFYFFLAVFSGFHQSSFESLSTKAETMRKADRWLLAST